METREIANSARMTGSPLQFLRLNDVKRLVGLGRSTIYARAAAGTFPAPGQIGPRAVAWSRAEVEDWIHSTIAASRAGSAAGGEER